MNKPFYFLASYPTTAFICITIKVDRQSQFIQGYRLFYRPSGGSWLLHDINSPSERSTVLTNLLKGTEYELKIRPYFDEFQGKDSRTLLVRTPEEGTEFDTSQPELHSKKSSFPKLNQALLRPSGPCKIFH